MPAITPCAPGDAPGPLPPGDVMAATRDDADFTSFYQRHFRACIGWLRAMGVPESDLDDLAQEVFLVVERRRGAVEVHDSAAWLYGIAWRTVSDHRRRTWWRNLLVRREPVSDETLVSVGDGPGEALERADELRILQRVLLRMSHLQRTTLLLFELEGYSGEQIAALQGVEQKTVWTRLHKARRSFVELADAERRAAIRQLRRRLG